jgi:uncharacterized membrane protein
MWTMPLTGAVLAIVAVRVIDRFEQYEGWRSVMRPETALAVLGTMSASLFTFIVFVASVLLVAVQLASSQLSPRIIGIIFRDHVTRASMTLFVFCFSFSIAALARIGEAVPSVTTRLAAYSGLVSLGMFLFLIDHAGRALRPSGALYAVGRTGRRVIASVYPRLMEGSVREAPAADAPLDVAAARVVTSARDGYVQAFDVAGLVAAAERAGCVVEVVPQVGEFVASGESLFRIFPAGAALSDAALRGSIALGQERTPAQDPTFSFRIIVDIASKGLSPAINDPTTAVLAIDQIHRLLRDVGRRCLDDERVRGSSGAVRLIYRTPGWDDFVQLAITEIRQFGAGSIQVARRLRALLDNLIQILPAERSPLLRQELDLLNRSIARFFPEPEDRALAGIGDLQGVGAKRGKAE